eukprot:m.367601 g.367601  ORF g.367601 m.367601 type:complete len:444 (-) comp28103_c0_seq1:4675-6006(-)
MRAGTTKREWIVAEDPRVPRDAATMGRSPSCKAPGSPAIVRSALQRLAGANSPMQGRVSSPAKRVCLDTSAPTSPQVTSLRSPTLSVPSPTAAASGRSRRLFQNVYASPSQARVSPRASAPSAGRSPAARKVLSRDILGNDGGLSPKGSPHFSPRRKQTTSSPSTSLESSVLSSSVSTSPSPSTSPTQSSTKPRFQSPVIARIEARRRAASSRKASRGAQTPGSARKSSRLDQIKGAGSRQQTWSGLRPRKRTSKVGCPATVEEEGGVPAQPQFGCANPSLNSLCSLLLEIEPPTGVLRIPLVTKDDLHVAKTRVADGAQLINCDLRKAAATIKQPTIGPLFQALLCRRATADSGPSGAMYASRDDRCGGARLDLSAIADVADSLSQRSVDIVQLLRIKLEDDGDLDQASKTLRDITTFFDQLKQTCDKIDMSQPEALAEMRA